MSKALLTASLLISLMATYQTLASEASFLNAMQGSYVGRGIVRLRTNLEPIKVKCRFRSSATASSLSLSGSCAGLVVISKKISADIRLAGTRYKGTYLGAGTGPAALSGKRLGNAIAFSVRWAKNVNGDRDATLTVEKVGAAGLTLKTTDRDPKTGKLVITSEIVMTRR
ncbi:hypothetical protein JJB09_25445 [Rhizobium sp. KVB221]|uniref:DUF1120 domain-containing protein n=1 Tax=Rhizobium setariae TaxID=2801340 RepID=A0A937CND4_9HYPH|nr:hypothetical protein [Rhizobium setariae]MBL0375365.1 hypothetical protein [Rhizobium setariae]